MSVRNISRQSCHYYMVTIFAKQQLCLRSDVTFSLELKTYNTWYVFKGLGYKISNYLECNLFIYNKIYIYTHTHERSGTKTGLEKMFEEGKADTVYDTITELYLYRFWHHARAVQKAIIHTYFFPKLPHCSHLGRCWFNSLGPRAAFDNRVYKNARSPVCPQVGVAPLVILMQFFFLFTRGARRGPEEGS